MSAPPVTSTLHGTPVVPGVAYGPALVVRGGCGHELTLMKMSRLPTRTLQPYG